jgi:GT2 family glycosyltransferase
MLLSVVIITWNTQQDVAICIDSVMEATDNRTTEIIVVDNGSTDQTCAILQSYGERLNLICLNRNSGVAVARNIGMKRAKGMYVWILDVDTVVNKDAVDGMMDYLSRHPECGLCACRLQSANGEVQDSCRRLPYPKHKIRNLIAGKTADSFFWKKIHEYVKKKNEKQFYRKELKGDRPFEVEYVIGACQLFRKKTLDEVGYLDEKIFYGPEDADFCLRINRKGYKIVCLPDISIIHHYNRMSNRKLCSSISRHHLKGLLYFYFKHQSVTPNPFTKKT